MVLRARDRKKRGVKTTVARASGSSRSLRSVSSGMSRCYQSSSTRISTCTWCMWFTATEPTPAPDSHDTRFRRIERRACKSPIGRIEPRCPPRAGEGYSLGAVGVTSPRAHTRDREVEVLHTFSCTHFPFVILGISVVRSTITYSLYLRSTRHTVNCNQINLENNLSIQTYA